MNRLVSGGIDLTVGVCAGLLYSVFMGYYAPGVLDYFIGQPNAQTTIAFCMAVVGGAIPLYATGLLPAHDHEVNHD